MSAKISAFVFRLFRLLIFCTLLAGASGVTPAHAVCSSAITVTNNADSGAGSLRQAITNVCSGGTITFDNDYTITLASQLAIVNKTVTITGAGHTITISGNNAVRVFHVGDYDTASSGNLTIDHLNIVNGASTVNACAGQAVSCGGGLMLDYLTTATVLNSTFSNNDGGFEGGAIYSYYGNPLTVTNSTFTGNHATAYAGAIELFYGSAILTNNTFTGNSADAYGSTLLNTWGTVMLRNNLFVKGATSVNACDSDFSDGGSTTDGGGNVRWGDTTCPGANANPLLGTLGDYGGDTPTMRLLPGSAAIDAASSNCPATDQRGIIRGSTCDSGAYESQGFTLTKTGGDNQSAVINTAFANQLSVIASEIGGSPLPGALVSYTAPASGASLTQTAFTATTDTQGIASATVTANGLTGSYIVTAEATGIGSANFSLTNVTLPDTTITGQPSDPSTAAPTFKFSGSDGVAPLGFECRLDSEGFSSCTSPKNYSGLSGGSHTFQVRAVDADDNRDATPASYTWTVDATAPTVSLSSTTFDPTNQNPITVIVTFSESVTGFTVDDIEPGNATVGNFSGSGASYSFTLAPSHSGAFTATIAGGVAFDAAGNGNTASNYFQRTYETVKPVVDTFTVEPVAHTLAVTITAFTASDNSGLIGGYLITESTEPPAQSDSRWSGTAPATYTVGSAGSYTLYPWAKDYAGNVSAVYGSPQTVTVCFSTATVTSNADSGAGTLRRAIADVCDNATITFSDNFTIVLASELTISKNLTIDGGGHSVTLSGNNAGRVLYVNSGVTFSLLSITVANGRCNGCDGGGLYNDYGTVNLTNVLFSGNSANNYGGGVVSLGPLTVTDSTFSGNSASLCGGGICNWSTATVTGSTFSGNGGTYYGAGLYSQGILNISSSTFSGNNAGYWGGGIRNGFGTANVTNVTFSGNSAYVSGGGFSNYCATATVTNSTFFGNSAERDGGGGLNNDSNSNGNSALTMINSIIAGSGGGNCSNTSYDGSSSVLNGADNLASDTTCGAAFTNSSSILLGTLGDYGGPTQTMPLLPGSAALDSGNDTLCAATDQRGIARSQGAACDIGAFESRGFTLSISVGDNQSAQVGAPFADPLSLTVTADNASEPVDGGQVTFLPPASGASAVITDSPATISRGMASATATANGTTGSYAVTATAAGISGNPVFNLINIAQPTTTTTAPVACTDDDGDGYGDGCAAGPDCDDDNPAVHESCTECTVRVFPKRIGWLIGEREATRRLLVIGAKEEDYDKNTPVSWNTGAIEILDTQVFLKRFMFLKVRIDGSRLDKGDYTVTVDNCTGTIHMMR